MSGAKRTVYTKNPKTGHLTGSRSVGGPGQEPPTVAVFSRPPIVPPRGGSKSEVPEAAARFREIVTTKTVDGGEDSAAEPAPKPLERFEGLATVDTQTPEWSIEEHREALNAAGIRLVVVDVETVSLDVRDGGVTEIGWYDINDAVGGSFVPPHSIEGADPKALEISRYHERIAHQTPAREQVAELHRILGGDGSNVNIVGSYPEFDRKHLNQLFAEHGLSPDPWGRRSVDVGAMFYWVSQRPIGSKQGLAAAAEEFGINNDDHHDAYSDAKVAAQVWHAMESRRARSFEAPF